MKQPSLFGDMSDSPLRRFENIHNYLYANDGLSEQQVLEEIIKILFIKFYDEQREKKSFYISNSESRKIDSGKNQSSFLNRIKQLFEETKRKYNSYFDSKDRLKLSSPSLAFVVKKLQEINFINSKNDANGLAFQKFLGRHAKGGRGQFFTPDPIIDFCVEIIQPEPNEKIIDPACGTGGFLFSSLRHIKETYKDVNLQNYVQKNIFGIEINARISQIAKIKFLIECNADPNILCGNALSDIKELSLKYNQQANLTDLESYFDVILTNPPFGTQGKITNHELLSKYELGYKWNKYGKDYIKSENLLKGQVPEILFIERCLQLLRPGGRLGVVLPNGHFENSSLEYLRRYIKDKANILGVVLLPQETFIPYGTGVKASLLFLQKKNGGAINSKLVFFSKIIKTGYAGNKNGSPVYKKDKYGHVLIENGQKIIDEDFSEVVCDYNQFLKTFSIKSEKSFSISSDQLNSRFDYNYYFPENRKLIANLIKLKSVRLCDVAKIVKNKSKRLKRNEIVEYVELSDIYTKSYEIINSTTLPVNDLPSRASYELKTGDVITAVAGNSIGTRKHATAYITEEFNKAICTNGFRILRNLKINPFYLLYYLQSDLFLKQVFMYRTGAAIPALSDEDFSNILIYLPPQNEIDKISSILEKCFQLRERAKNEIEKIKTAINIKHITQLTEK
ncbi:N-6 DNA methylase [Desulfococcaceae bacterium HSG7]|nr:N-6 DNA methylase [Desulfococcaceae bacterium HSG7]